MIFYNLSVRLYWIVILVLSPFYGRAKKFVTGRRQNMLKNIPEKNRGKKRIWMHVSSLGEFEQGRPLLEKIRSENPEIEIVLSFFSPSGFEVRKNYEKADHVLYMLMDFPSKARAFFEKVNPDLIVIVKYEFWLHHLYEAFRRSIPVIYISAIFNKNQIYFNRGSGLYIPVFKKIDQFFVQNETSKNLLSDHGIRQVTISGDTRFDRVVQIASTSKPIPEVEDFLGGKECFVFGSIWNSDLDIIASFIHEIKYTYKVIIAPHNIDEEHVEEVMDEFPEAVRFSKYESDPDNNVLIIDNMGMLSTLYGYAKYAFIGGAFRGALHNTIEAAVYGIPVFFGEHKNNQKFAEAIALKNGGGAFSFMNIDELKRHYSYLEKDRVKYEKAAQFCKGFVQNHRGATKIAFEYLQKYFK